jgi:hypothetical protein
MARGIVADLSSCNAPFHSATETLGIDNETSHSGMRRRVR